MKPPLIIDNFAGGGGVIRHLIPRAQWSGWCGDALTVLPPEQRCHPECRHDSVKGGTICLQWLGLIVEIAVGRVH